MLLVECGGLRILLMDNSSCKPNRRLGRPLRLTHICIFFKFTLIVVGLMIRGSERYSVETYSHVTIEDRSTVIIKLSIDVQKADWREQVLGFALVFSTMPEPIILSWPCLIYALTFTQLYVASLLSVLPRMLEILLCQLSLHPGGGDLARHACHCYLRQKTHAGDRALPVRNIIGLELDQRHSGVARRPIVHPISQVPEPCTRAFAVDFFDSRVFVVGHGNLATHADPVLAGGVLEGHLGRLVVFKIGELFGMGVGKEEEVGAVALSNSHGPRDGPNAWADGGEEADFEGVGDLVEVLDLIFLGSLVIPLLGDGRVGLGVDIGFCKWFRHGCGGLVGLSGWL